MPVSGLDSPALNRTSQTGEGSPSAKAERNRKFLFKIIICQTCVGLDLSSHFLVSFGFRKSGQFLVFRVLYALALGCTFSAGLSDGAVLDPLVCLHTFSSPLASVLRVFLWEIKGP